jgi:hypothetical protein
MPELVIIFSFIIVLALIVFGTLATMHKRTLAYRERQRALDREDAGSNPTGAKKKVEQLEHRVRVLERLATDRGPDLVLQIEELRGTAAPDFAPSNEESRV